MAEELKACDYCKAIPVLRHIVAGPQVRCEMCLCSGPAISTADAYTDEEHAECERKAIDAWNTRAKSAPAEPDAELVELLREARELIEHGDFREGHCMCGSAVEAHGFGDGHSPVDAGVYYAGQVMERIDAKLASLEVKP